MGWKIYGKDSDILEIWEDIFGNLWFVSEHVDENEKFGYVRFYNLPQFAEWGYFSISEIKEAVGELKVWKVPKKDWINVNTYENNLLVEVKDKKIKKDKTKLKKRERK